MNKLPNLRTLAAVFVLPAVVLGVCLFLAGCDTRPETAEWQNVCVASHDELSYFTPVSLSCGDNCSTVIFTPVYDTVCDQYEVQCVAGKDGTTECKR